MLMSEVPPPELSYLSRYLSVNRFDKYQPIPIAVTCLALAALLLPRAGVWSRKSGMARLVFGRWLS
jgi:hypothetical protein